MFENFPYSDMHQLNLDWIIKIAKDFLDQYTHIQELIQNGETSISELTETSLADLDEKAAHLEQLLQAWYDTHSAELAAQIAEGLSSITTAEQQAIALFTTQANTRAEAAIASIPQDYSTFYANALTLRNLLTDQSDLNTTLETGIYFYNTNSLPDHLPTNVSVGGMVLVYKRDSSYTQQMLVTNNRQVFQRYITPVNIDLWNEIDRTPYVIDDTNDANNIKSTGFYFFVTSSKPAHIPTAASGGLLQVVARDTDYCQQFLTCNNNRMFFRYINNGLDSDWKEIEPVYIIDSTNSLANITDSGVYFFLTSSLPLDLPSGVEYGGVMQVFKRITDSYCMQYLTINDGNIFFRYINNGNAQDWQKIITEPHEKEKYIALGDSITEGYFSTPGSSSISVTPDNYVYYISKYNNYKMTNAGVGGTGYNHTNANSKNAKTVVNQYDFADYDIVTIGWGINDWHYEDTNIGTLQSTAGDNTLIGNMKYVIEKILTDNPAIKIVVILPQNTSKFGGSASTNWGLGYDLAGKGTLQDFVDAEKAVCEYYGIQYIDPNLTGIVNRNNINTLLPDGLHPSVSTYRQMAKCFCNQIMYY